MVGKREKVLLGGGGPPHNESNPFALAARLKDLIPLAEIHREREREYVIRERKNTIYF